MYEIYVVRSRITKNRGESHWMTGDRRWFSVHVIVVLHETDEEKATHGGFLLKRITSFK